MRGCGQQHPHPPPRKESIPDDRPTVSLTHLAIVLTDGSTIALPMTAWLDQTFARQVLSKAGAYLPPPLDDDAWIDLVFLMHHNDEKAT